MDKDIEEWLKNSYDRDLRHTLEMAILFKFPEIKNLRIESEDKVYSISFQEGDYTKEEVESFLNELQKQTTT
jgi:hypothetical protein